EHLRAIRDLTPFHESEQKIVVLIVIFKKRTIDLIKLRSSFSSEYDCRPMKLRPLEHPLLEIGIVYHQIASSFQLTINTHCSKVASAEHQCRINVHFFQLNLKASWLRCIVSIVNGYIRTAGHFKKPVYGRSFSDIFQIVAQNDPGVIILLNDFSRFVCRPIVGNYEFKVTVSLSEDAFNRLSYVRRGVVYGHYDRELGDHDSKKLNENLRRVQKKTR